MEVKKTMGKWTELIKTDKFRHIMIPVGILGIALIYLSSFFGQKQKEEIPQSKEEPTASGENYEQQLEERLVQIVAAITGEANPVVMVTLETTGKSIYAVDENTKANEAQEYENGEKVQEESTRERESAYVITKDAEGNQRAVKVSELQPEIKGVVVVSKYAADVFVQEKIINAVKTVMNLSSSKICVVSAK